MKFLFILSLIFNGVLGFLYYPEKSRPPLERIVVEEKTVVKKVTTPPVASAMEVAKPASNKESKVENDFQPIMPGDEHGLQMAVEDLETVKKDFFLKQDISEKTLKKEEETMQELYQKTAPIYQKHPTGITLTFDERRKIIDLEEEAQNKIRSLFGEEKWSEYKNFVDRHNKKIIEGSKTGEYTGVLMGY